MSDRRCACLATAADCPSDEAEKADGCVGGFRYGAPAAALVGCCCERLQVRGVDDRAVGSHVVDIDVVEGVVALIAVVARFARGSITHLSARWRERRFRLDMLGYNVVVSGWRCNCEEDSGDWRYPSDGEC